MTKRPKQIGIMKAKPITPGLVERLGEYCFAQPKLRGQHGRILWPVATPVAVSSYGNAFTFLDHIIEELHRWPNQPFVGEFYRHGWSQEKINSVLNRTTNPHPEVEEIQLQIFDLALPVKQFTRFMKLDLLDMPRTNFEAPVSFLGYEHIKTRDWEIYCAKYLKLGYEGIILRDTMNIYTPIDPFELVKRPSSVLKFKPRERDEYEIIGYTEGTGWATGMLGSFLVKDASGATFSVGTGKVLDKEGRMELWEVRESLPGRTLVVLHEPITTVNGLPICTSAYEIK